MIKNNSNNFRATCTFEEAYRALFDIAIYAYYNFTGNNQTRFMNIFLLSLEGCGKTHFIKKYASEKGLQYVSKKPKEIAYTDLSGMDIPIGGTKATKELIYLLPQWLKSVIKTAEEEKKKGKPIILFIDEFTAVDLDTKKVFLGVILERELRGIKLPDNIIIVAAGNYDDRDIDAPTYNRFIVASLDRTQLEQLPICISTESELDEIVDNSTYHAFGKGSPIELMNHSFNGITVPENEIDNMISILRGVLKKALVVRNTKYSPQDLNLDDKTGGAKNLSMSLRMAGFVTDFLFAAVKTNNWKPIILRIACDNLGCFDVDGKPLYADLTKVKTKLVIDGENISITYDDYVKKYEFLTKDQYLFTDSMDKFTETDVELMYREFSYLMSTFEYNVDSVPDDLYDKYKVTLGIITKLYTTELNDGSEKIMTEYNNVVKRIEKLSDDLVSKLIDLLHKVRKFCKIR